MGMQLWDGSVDDTEAISNIQTDEEYAKRYEHNKKREELQRLEELKKKGLDRDSEDDSSESEETDDELISGKSDAILFDVLTRIKNRDPIILQEGAKYESEEEEEEKVKLKKAKKPDYLKTVNAKILLEKGPEWNEEDEEEEEGGLRTGTKSYLEEQDEHLNAVLKAVEEDFDEEGELLREKKRDNDNDRDDDGNEEVVKYFGKEEEKLAENELFLKKFFLEKPWVNKDKGKKPYTEDLDDDVDLDEDEEALENMDRYEKNFNFRFEEETGDRVLGHARFTEGSVRRKSNARQLQRKSKEERMAQAEIERKEELKHMKNLKKKEIEEKLEKIRAIAGIDKDGACALDENDLEEEFDPDEYDRKMKETFDGDYYDKEDADPGFGSEDDEDDLKKPDFDKEDELLGLPKDWDVIGSTDGFSAAREQILKRKAENKDVVFAGSEEVEEELPAESKRKRKRKISLREKLALDKDLEEYYKLDYEDTIGDLKTRFKYTSVPSQRYGLNQSEMLLMDDKELNQYVPLKKIAPYREKEWKVPNAKRHSLKLKASSLVKGVDVKDQKSHKKHKRKLDDQPSTEVETLEQGETQLDKSHTFGEGADLKDQRGQKKHKKKHDGDSTEEAGALEHREPQRDESNDDVDKISRRSKRRRRQAELKLSYSRQLAYGLVPAASKKKKKH